MFQSIMMSIALMGVILGYSAQVSAALTRFPVIKNCAVDKQPHRFVDVDEIALCCIIDRAYDIRRKVCGVLRER